MFKLPLWGSRATRGSPLSKQLVLTEAFLPSRFWPSHGTILWGLGLVIVLVVSLSVYYLWRDHEDALRDADALSLSYARTTDSRIDAMGRRVDAVLEFFVQTVPRDTMAPGAETRFGNELNKQLALRLHNFPEAHTVLLIDLLGNLRYGVDRTVVKAANYADRQWFKDTLKSTTNKTIISEVVLGELSQKPTIALVRPLRDKNGTMFGMVLFALNLSELQNQLKELRLGPNGSVALRRLDDHSLVVRWPHLEVEVNKPLASSNAIVQGVTGGLREFNARIGAQTSGRGRIFGVKVTEGNPFYSIVGVSQEDVLAKWRVHVIVSGVFSLLIVGLILVLMVTLWITGAAREKAQAELEKYRDILEERLIESERLEHGLRSSKARLSGMIESANEGIISVDSQQRIHQFNKAAEQMFGYPFADIIGQSLTRLIPHSVRARHQSHIDAFAVTDRSSRTMAQQANLLGLRANGETFPIEVSISGVSVDGQTVFTAIVRDITERRKFESELQNAKAVAESANRAKSEFLSSMSHELRTPLNSILGFAQFLGLNAEEPLTDDQKESVGYILKGGQHLLVLIDKVLDLAKIEARVETLSLEGIALIGAVNDCLNMIRLTAAKRGIEPQILTTLKHDVSIRVDATRFKQVLLNFLSNAVKYNREGGALSVGLFPADDDMIRIAVTDGGPGIPVNRQSEVFQPFNRLGAEMTSVEGTGIGLTVTKNLVEMMGGRIGFESQVGKGSTFWVEFLIDHSLAAGYVEITQQQATLGFEVAPAQREKHILYIDDNAANRDMMKTVFKLMPRSMLALASTAAAGLELAITQRPDLILMDITMPEMDGFQALKALRSREATRNIPVIAVSALARASDIEKGNLAGFNAYLTKPINVNEALIVIRNSLEKAL